ncbi:10923_t:CDS:2, partial [Gigaspora rosea]
CKDRAHKLNDIAERSFRRVDVTSFFKDLMHRLTNVTENFANATEILVSAKENLYESKLKSQVYRKYGSKSCSQQKHQLLPLLGPGPQFIILLGKYLIVNLKKRFRRFSQRLLGLITVVIPLDRFVATPTRTITIVISL